MALNFKDSLKNSLALTQIDDASSKDTLADSNELAEEGYGAATAEEIATYDMRSSSGIEYNQKYPVYDVFEDSEISVINANKGMTVSSSQLNLTEERNSQYIPFSMPRYSDGYDLSNGIVWIITDASKGDPEAEQEVYPVQPINVYVDKNKLYFGWLVDGYITRRAATINFEIHVHGQVQGIKDGQEVVSGYVWKTKPSVLKVSESKFNIDNLVTDHLIQKNENWLDDIVVNVVGQLAELNLSGAADAKEAAEAAQAAAEEAQAAVEEALRVFNDETREAVIYDAIVAAEEEALRAADKRLDAFEEDYKEAVDSLITEYEHDVILGYKDRYPKDPEKPEETPALLTVKDYVAQELSTAIGEINTAETSVEEYVADKIKTAIETAAEDASAKVGVLEENVSIEFENTKQDLNEAIENMGSDTIDYIEERLGDLGVTEEEEPKKVVDVINETLKSAQDYADTEISDKLGSLSFETDKAVVTGETVTAFVQAAIEAVDISDTIGSLKLIITDEDGTEREISYTNVTDFVKASVDAVDISDTIGDLKLVITDEDGTEREISYDTVADFVKASVEAVDVTEQLENYATINYVTDAISKVDVTGQLVDYVKTEALNSVIADVEKNTNSIADLEVAIDAMPTVHTYNIDYDVATNALNLYEYTDEENQEGNAEFIKSTVVIAGGGGGGGGGATSLTVTRLTNNPYIIPSGEKAAIEYKIEAFEMNGTELGEGLTQVTANWKLNGKTIKNDTLVLTNGVYEGTGANAFNITDYINGTKQRFVLTVTAEDGTLRTRDWYAYEVDLSIDAPSFDDAKPYNDDVAFRYVPYGNISKDIYFVLDGEEIGKVTTTVSGSSQTFTIPAQEHGAHLLEVYMKANIEGQELESNHVYKDIIWFDDSVGTTVIGSTYQNFTTRQHESTPIEYVVYAGASIESAKVEFEASYIDAETGETVVEFTKEATVDTGIKQVWTYKSGIIGTHTLTIRCNGETKILIGEVTELKIDVEPVTGGLVFDFDPTGYSNEDADRVWSYTNAKGETYSMILSENFDWVNGGYKLDNNDDQYFLIKAGTTATIDYELFGDDAKQTGKEFKLVFKTQNVADGETVILDCLSEIEIADEESGEVSLEQIGFQMKAHEATIYAKSETLPLPYAEEEIIEFEFNIAQQDEPVPMVMGYEDGVSTRPMIYDSTHSFQQRAGHKKQIVIGSEACDILIYRFKVYNVSLSDEDILANFITDARNADEMISRFDRNEIYDPENNFQLTPEYLAEVCPWLRVIKIECPRFTNDKSDFVGETKIEMIYKNGDPVLDNWYTEDCVHSGQGTSSNAYGPSARNLDLIMKLFEKKGVYYNENPKIFYSDGTETNKVSFTRESVPVNYFNIKVNVASSENANNALLAKRYNQYNPYDRPFVRYGDALEDHFTEEEIAEMTEEQKTTLLAEYQAKADSIIPYIKDTMEFHNCVIFLKETGKYADGSDAKFTEFDDGLWHFYAIGNIGDSKKTDDTRLTDPRDPYECIIEVMDNTMPLSTFPTGYTNEDGSPKYPITESQWEDMNNPAYSALYYEKFDETKAEKKANGLADTYGMRYLWEDGETDEENNAAFEYVKNKWREFYKFIVTSDDDKFKRELGDWVVLDSILYYYLFTLRYTMTDNHAKNCFWHYGKSNDTDADGNPIRKWDLCFDYDNDTALGIDNLGRMTYRYGYEEIDFVDGTENEWVWNAPQHVFFQRIRENFKAELDNLFKVLESKDAWSAEGLISQWNEWQAQFPEELWRLDIQRKYIRPYADGAYVNGSGGKYPEFLKLRANGRKKTQRSQFEKNQEKYMASKFNGNVARNDKLYLRCQADAASATSKAVVPPNYDFYLTPFSHCYLNVKYGTSDVGDVRAKPGQTYHIPFNGGVNSDVDIIEVYSASCLQDLGDLSPFYLKEGTFTPAKKISRLKLGNSKTGYNNPSNIVLALGQNDLLKSLDLTNVGGFTSALDLSGLLNLKELYAFGTSSAGITFAEGGAAEWVDLPAVSTLIMKDLSYLKDATYDEDGKRTGGLLAENLSKLTDLVAENSELDLISLINRAPNLYRVRLVGINWTLMADQVNLLERLYNMTGRNNAGSEIEQSVLTGYVYVPSINEYTLYKYQERWPELTIDYGTMIKQYPVRFFQEENAIDAEGKEPIEIQYITAGGYASLPTAIPQKESTISTTYEFDEWTIDFDEEGMSYAQIYSATDVYARYTSDVRKYHVEYVVNYRGTNYIQYRTTEPVPYNSYVPYEGEIPTYSYEEGEGGGGNYYIFEGWDKSGYVWEGPNGTDLDGGKKIITAKFSEPFSYEGTIFRNRELADLSPVEIYAISKIGLTTVTNNGIGSYDESTGKYSGIQQMDEYSFYMGRDVDYEDVSGEELINVEEPKTFTGSTSSTGNATSYYDTKIPLLDEDKDFVLAMDFTMESGATIAQCYQGSSALGFQVNYEAGNVKVIWNGKTASYAVAKAGQRELLVLRHKAGDSNLYIYSSNLDDLEPLSQTVETVKTGTGNTTLVFGAGKNDQGKYINPGVGTVHWAKIWWKDLGEEICKELAGWTHEKIVLEVDGFDRYYIDGSINQTTLSLIGKQLLDRPMSLNKQSANQGGYPNWTICSVLNERFYKAMPWPIQFLTKPVKTKYTLGGNTGEVSTDPAPFHVLLPTVFDLGVTNGTNGEHLAESGGSQYNKTYIDTASERIRKYPNGLAGEYWTRSAVYVPGQSTDWYKSRVYYIDDKGEAQNWSGDPANKRGILIEISF